jgi:hypothetical protein
MMKRWTFLFAAAATVSVLVARAQDTSPDPTDALERAKAKGKLVACADPYSYPYSEEGAVKPGFDVEIFQQIATRGGMRAEMFWVNTASRGGLGRAFRQSILAKRCDVFLGLSDDGDEDMLGHQLVFTEAYLGLGYVLVVQGKAENMKTLDELKQGNIKIGVSMSTPMDDYLFTNKIPRELYFGSQRVLQGMAKGEVDAAVVWATAVAVGKREFPNAKFHMVDSYVPPEGQRYNMKFAVRKEDESLLKFVNDGIRELLGGDKVKPIVESYGVPYYQPFAS